MAKGGGFFPDDPVFNGLFNKWWRGKDPRIKDDIFVSYLFEHQMKTLENRFMKLIKMMDQDQCKDFLLYKLRENRRQNRPKKSASRRCQSKKVKKEAESELDNEPRSADREVDNDAELYNTWHLETRDMLMHLPSNAKSFFGDLLKDFLYVLGEPEFRGFVIGQYKARKNELDNQDTTNTDAEPSTSLPPHTCHLMYRCPNAGNSDREDKSLPLDRHDAYEIATQFSSIQRAASYHSDSPLVKNLNWDKLKVDLIKNHLNNKESIRTAPCSNPFCLSTAECYECDKCLPLITLILHYITTEEIRRTPTKKGNLKRCDPILLKGKCVICLLEKPTEKHYERKICVECKEIFEQVIMNREVLICGGSKENCGKVATCRRCRFRKCLLSGMNFEEVERLRILRDGE